jgi:hypothetical protein
MNRQLDVYWTTDRQITGPLLICSHNFTMFWSCSISIFLANSLGRQQISAEVSLILCSCQYLDCSNLIDKCIIQVQLLGLAKLLCTFHFFLLDMHPLCKFNPELAA